MLAEEAGAFRVPGGNFEHILLATLQSSEHLRCPSCGVVGSRPIIFFGIDKIVDSTFWTGVPAYCDVIVAASGHASQTRGRADD